MSFVAAIGKRFQTDKKTAVSVVFYSVFLVFYCAYEGLGLVKHENPLVAPIALVCLGVLIVVLYFRTTLCKKWERALAIIRPLSHFLFIFIGFFLLESSYNELFSEMSRFHMGINVAIVALLYGIIYFFGQRSKTSIIIFLLLCFGMGIANYFVVMFKGQPVIPSDFFALSTAFSVSSNYVYVFNDATVKSFIALVSACAFVQFLPKVPLNKRSILLNCICALLLTASFFVWFETYDIKEEYNCKVDPWFLTRSYSDSGSLLCFLKCAQDLNIKPPEGYSQEKVSEILEGYNTATLQLYEPDEKPTVIMIMNEGFSDLSQFDSIADRYAGPEYLNSLSEVLYKGTVHMSNYGGGTCNSEFEALTSVSMAFIGSTSYPYVFNKLENVNSLPKYFKSQGYNTTAVHPAEKTNWRRDMVYTSIGFDHFADLSEFKESETLRGLPTDKATYEYVLDLLEDDQSPQFIFDVTMQNHSGYTTGDLPEDMILDSPLHEDPEINEYIPLIKKSDEDLKEFIESLENLDRPIVLCFFGDHQPMLTRQLSEETLGKSVVEYSAEEIQSLYNTPCLIWSNYITPFPLAKNEISESTSLNYLGPMIIRACGLPLSPLQKYLLDLQEKVLATNSHGYLDNQGSWHSLDEENKESEYLAEYALIQYAMMFDTNLPSEYLYPTD